jgi:hypothetical protein
MLCVKNPRASYGSMEVLLPASRSQKQTTASHKMPTTEYKQDDRTEERANGDERAAAAPPRAPGPITGRADQRLYHQSSDRSGQVQDRELIGISADQEEERIHRRLGQAEAELNSEEPEIHHQDGGARHQWFALDLPSVRRD